MWKTVQAHPSAAVFPDGESMAEMSARAVAAVRRWDARVEAEHGPDAVWVAVSHGDVIKAILADALGIHLDTFQRIVVDPASLSVVRYTPLRPFVVTHEHLRRRPRPTCKPRGKKRRTPQGEQSTQPSVAALGPPPRLGRMASVIHSFDPPERFVAGTVGPPGQRTFFLQARTGARVTSVALEKQQVSVLAERIDELLDELLRRRRGRQLHPGDAAGGAGGQRPPRAADRRGVPRRHHDAVLGRGRRADRRRGLPVQRGDASSSRAPPRRRSRSPSPRRCSSCGCPPGWPARSASARRPSSAPGGSPARSAAARSTRPGTCARGPTASGGPRPNPRHDRPAASRRPARRRRRRARAAEPRRDRAPRPDHAGVQRDLLRHGHARRASSIDCVYKPVAGERPLWDFPDGTLAGREVAAYVVSEALGWDVVPPTVLRGDAPAGPGMVQAWREPDDGPGPGRPGARPGRLPEGYLHVLDAYDGDDQPVSLVHEDSDALRRMAVFDIVVNNADRKGGHVLAMPDGHRFGVDHGVAFHVDDKLRTVLWGWAAEPLDPDGRRRACARSLDRLRADRRALAGAARRAARRRRGGGRRGAAARCCCAAT